MPHIPTDHHISHKPPYLFPLSTMHLSTMLLRSPTTTPPYTTQCHHHHHHHHRIHRRLTVTSKAKQPDDQLSTTTSLTEKLAIAGGLIATPVIGWSLYTLKTTGCGLPPGPGGSIGALEGVSYLVVVGIVGWSLYTKAKTGSGLPNGPFGLLGAVEGVSYLTLVAILVVFGLQFYDQGSIPGPVPVPGDQCFG